MACLKAIKRSVLIGFLILTTVENIRAPNSPCPPGWFHRDQSCYIKLLEKMTWFEAVRACTRLGSGLIVPDSREENDFIWNLVSDATDGIWIGCTDAAEEGVWLCGGQPAKFINWKPGFPSLNNRERNCARMTTHPPAGRWADGVPCDETGNPKWAACEMSACAVPAYHTFTGPNGRVSQKYPLHQGIKNPTVEGMLTCSLACKADQRCRSFNLWLSGKREKMRQHN